MTGQGIKNLTTYLKNSEKEKVTRIEGTVLNLSKNTVFRSLLLIFEIRGGMLSVGKA